MAGGRNGSRQHAPRQYEKREDPDPSQVVWQVRHPGRAGNSSGAECKRWCVEVWWQVKYIPVIVV